MIKYDIEYHASQLLAILTETYADPRAALAFAHSALDWYAMLARLEYIAKTAEERSEV